jgi:2-polyprenyl-3-methyl-5-hydroxy-6-metoxy-1,4-benzoquinol methylase
MKKIIKKLLNVLGIQIILNKKKSASKYFNTGKLSPIEENSVVLYDNFYGDVNAVNEYYKGFRIEFYEKVLKNVKESGVELDGKNIIDVGCGVGYLLEKIQRQAKPIKLSGADFSYEAVKASITRFKGIEFFQYDVSY